MELLTAIASLSLLAVLSYFFAPPAPVRSTTAAGSWASLAVSMPNVTWPQPRRPGAPPSADAATPVLIAVAILSLSAVAVGAYALFTARTTNPGSGVATGTLTMSNSKAGTAVFSVSGLRPGDSATGAVTIANTGSLDGTYTLSIANVAHGGTGGGDLSSILTVVISDELARSVYAGAFATMPETALPGAAGVRWASGESHTYTFVVTIPSTAGNAYQDTSATAEYV